MSTLKYNVEDKLPLGKAFLYAFQQVLAIVAATIAVPAIVGNGMSPSAALFGAGAGTLVYLLITKFKSPVFLGSSFGYIGPMSAAFAGAVTVSAGYLGLIIGGIMIGIVYIVMSIVIKKVGTKWINVVMPAVVIGPVVALIGLTLSKNAIVNLFQGGFYESITQTGVFSSLNNLNIVSYETLSDGNFYVTHIVSTIATNKWIALSVGLVTLFTILICSTYGGKMLKALPFVIGILAGYLLASIYTGIGWLTNTNWLKVIDFEVAKNIEWIPNFSFLTAFKAFKEFNNPGEFFSLLATVAVAYIPVAFVSMSEHIADHKNLSSIVERDLIRDPGLHKTLMGDGFGTMIGSFLGGCPNTTYGESIGTIALSGNASVQTIFLGALICMAISFIGPFSAIFGTVPPCIIGGLCVCLYGFIGVSGFKLFKNIDFTKNSNIFTVSVILVFGIGEFILDFGQVKITQTATALIAGILVNLLCNIKRKNKTTNTENAEILPHEEKAS
ncbi:MAG: uracil-xanthine permease [Bacilli bacterium]|nr:uracil-xanthine permease [Bacilli bacterium]